MWFRRRRSQGRVPILGQPVDVSMLEVPIELADGSRVTELRSAPRWQQVAREASVAPDEQPVLVEELVGEEHHRWYGRAWSAGRFRFEFLLAHGLAPRDRVLDLGCGAGRLGIWLIAFLEPGRYFGVDRHLRSLVAFSAYEIRLHGLAAKRPRLLLDGDFRVDCLGERFDVVLDVSVTRFLPVESFRQAYARLRAVLAPGARVFVAGLTADRLEQLRSQGFELLFEGRPERPPHLSRRPHSAHNAWHVLRLA
jgi:SAM-dependent methyltransferase